MAKRRFKLGTAGGHGGVGWIGKKYYDESCVVELDEDVPEEMEQIRLLERAGSVVSEIDASEGVAPPEEEIPLPELDDMSINELRKFGRSNALPVTNSMKKDELIELIRGGLTQEGS